MRSIVLRLAVACLLMWAAAAQSTPCSITANCTNHASAVQGNSAEGCICTCRNQWFGASCQFCPPGIDTTADCGACLPGYEGFPFCALACTIQGNCSGHASQVQGDTRNGCICNCRNNWVGADCSVCPPGLDPAADCGACLPGYSGYPFCAKTCTISASCSNHASNVSGNAETGCMCQCRNLWYGASCQACPAGVDTKNDCAACLPGYNGYPFCAKTCTLAASCSSHASNVTGNAQTGCQCTCRGQWTGPSCQSCPPGIDGTKDCSVCLAGYEGYPFCAKTCTNTHDCSGNAVNVTGDAKTGCLCTCRNSWAGGTCNYCPPNFNSHADCAACATGFTNYPFCVNANAHHPRDAHAHKQHVDEPPRRFRRGL